MAIGLYFNLIRVLLFLLLLGFGRSSAARIMLPGVSPEMDKEIRHHITLMEKKAKVVDTTWLGTGTIINDNGDILTANHVVALNAYTLIYYNGQVYNTYIKFQLPRDDIAVIHADLPHTYSHYGFATGFNIGDKVTGIGYGIQKGDRWLSFSQGVIVDTYTPPFWDHLRIYTNSFTCEGMSGGPLLNRHNQILGELWGSDEDDRVCSKYTIEDKELDHPYADDSSDYAAYTYITKMLTLNRVKWDTNRYGTHSAIVNIFGPDKNNYHKGPSNNKVGPVFKIRVIKYMPPFDNQPDYTGPSPG